MLLTMSVSAFWHGVHPGYYLSFLTVPLCTLAEDNILSIVPKDANGKFPVLFVILLLVHRSAAWFYVDGIWLFVVNMARYDTVLEFCSFSRSLDYDYCYCILMVLQIAGFDSR
ncbi:unnamed protein product [Gongylonema pulchrum]|uniref:Membrane bound O-acyl transferase family protein n=1 Tax=Gongylonema pulchrum TaxID=637853 RepID=A0A183DA52_9BILA|nr:unnamed protein product [Gongylonema pulchrum]